MVIVDALVDLVVDCNFVLFLADVEEDASLIPALCLFHEVFAVLNCAEEYPQSGAEVRESLNKKIITIRAAAADLSSTYVT